MSWKCERCGELNDEQAHLACWKCRKSRFGGPEVGTSAGGPALLCSTTIEIPGRQIEESMGVVFGEAIMGANIFRDLLAGVRDIVGGRSGTYESKIREARMVAIQEMLLDAGKLGADAVIGIDVDYETVGQAMLMVCASGTAVRLRKA
jgi:uncharacterized protein YbjQ (UPF0145 family)